MAKLTNRVRWTRFITSSTDKHYSLDSEDDFRSGCWNVSHQKQFFSELPSPGRSHYMNYWYSWVQTIYSIWFAKNTACVQMSPLLSCHEGTWFPLYWAWFLTFAVLFALSAFLANQLHCCLWGIWYAVLLKYRYPFQIHLTRVITNFYGSKLGLHAWFV